MLCEPVLRGLRHAISSRLRVPWKWSGSGSTSTGDRDPLRSVRLSEQATHCLVQHDAGQDVDVEALGEVFGVSYLEGSSANGDAGVGLDDIDAIDSSSFNSLNSFLGILNIRVLDTNKQLT